MLGRESAGIATHAPSIDTHDADAVAKLVDQVRRDPEHHCEEFYRAFWPDAYRIAYSIMNSEHDADDIAHVALIRAFDKIGTLNNPKAGLAWIRRIVGTTALDHRRDEQRRFGGMTPIDGDISDLDGTADSAQSFTAQNQILPDELVMRDEVKQIVFDLVKTLPTKQYQAIILYYYLGLSTQQIAEDMDISETAVGSLLFRARNTLNERIQEVEQTQDIRLYSVPMLPLGPLLSSAIDTFIEVPNPVLGILPNGELATPCSQKTIPQQSGEPGPSLESAPQSSAQPTSWQPVSLRIQFWIGGALLVGAVLAGGLWYLNQSDVAHDAPIVVSEIADRDDTADRTRPPADSDETTKIPDRRVADARPQDTAPNDKQADQSTSSSPQTSPSAQPPANDPGALTDIVVPGTPSTPVTPPATTRPPYPDNGSYICFGTQSGAPLLWQVTSQTQTTLTVTKTTDIASLAGVFSGAESAVILSQSAGSRPTLVLDGTRLGFLFADGFVYAQPR